ncbi:MAG: hypothetical protein U1F10_01815 [Burkholderiales bacterium]
MDTTVTPAGIASLLARNLIAPIGVLFFAWSATNLLILYYLDTVLEFAVLMLLIGRHVTGIGPAGSTTRPFEGPADWIKMGAASLVLAIIIGLPLGAPLFILLSNYQFSWEEVLNSTFMGALASQAAASLFGAYQAHQMLLARSDDEHVLKHRVAFVFGRWLVMCFAAAFVPAWLLGRRFGGFVLVAIYAGTSIYFELFPGRALRWLNPKEAAADEREQAKVRDKSPR